MAPAAGFERDVEACGDAQRSSTRQAHTLAGVCTNQGRLSGQARGAAAARDAPAARSAAATRGAAARGAPRGEAQVAGSYRTCSLPRARCRCREPAGQVSDDSAYDHLGTYGGTDVEPSSSEDSDAPACRDGEVSAACTINATETSQEEYTITESWEPTATSEVPHFYVDVPCTDESTVDVEDRHVPIDPAFHAHLQEQEEGNISHFLALPEVIPMTKRKRAQPFMDFTKSRILTSADYTQRCEDVLAQRLAHEIEAKQKAQLKEANRETRLREKEEHARGVRERAIAREAQQLERQRLESER